MNTNVFLFPELTLISTINFSVKLEIFLLWLKMRLMWQYIDAVIYWKISSDTDFKQKAGRVSALLYLIQDVIFIQWDITNRLITHFIVQIYISMNTTAKNSASLVSWGKSFLKYKLKQVKQLKQVKWFIRRWNGFWSALEIHPKCIKVK